MVADPMGTKGPTDQELSTQKRNRCDGPQGSCKQHPVAAQQMKTLDLRDSRDRSVSR